MAFSLVAIPPLAPGVGVGPRAAVGIVFFSLPFAQTFLVPGVSLADVCLLVACALTARELLVRRRLPRAQGWAAPVLVMIAWSLVGAAVLAQRSSLPFSLLEYLKSLAKLVFYAVGALLVADTAWRWGAARWSQWLLHAAVAHSVIGIYAYVAVQSPWHLPYRFLWKGSQGPETTAFAYEAGASFARLRGVAAEPSYCGFFLVGGLALAWLADPSRRAGCRDALVALAITLTLSLSAYALAAVSLPLLLTRQRGNRDVWMRRCVVAGGALLLALLVPQVREAVRVCIVDRIVGIGTGTLPGHSLVRLSGSYEAAALMAGRSPLWGAGLGNYDVAMAEIARELDPALGMGAGHEGWSAPAYVLGTMGWPGLLLLAWVAAALARHDWPAGVLFAALATADGTFLGAPFWVFLALLSVAWASRGLNASGASATARHGGPAPS